MLKKFNRFLGHFIYFLITASKHLSEVQVFGGALVPKRALHLMDAEVNRLLLLGKDCIVPLSYQVPRKVHRKLTIIK